MTTKAEIKNLAREIAKREGITIAAVEKRWEDNRRKEEERQKRLVTKVYWTGQEELEEGDILSGVSYRIVTDPQDGYSCESGKVYISVSKGGAISFHDEFVENFIYFYPDQLKHLAMALNRAKVAKRKLHE